jgi:hypothetical protein
MNILVVYPYIPYPIDRGTYQRVFHLLRALAKDHTVDLAALSEKGERVEHRDVFESFCRQVIFVPFEHPPWPRLFSNRRLNPLPTRIQHWWLPQLADTIGDMLDRNEYDMVHVCDIVMAQYFLKDRLRIPLRVDRDKHKVARRSWGQGVCDPDNKHFIPSNVSMNLPVQAVTNGVDFDCFSDLDKQLSSYYSQHFQPAKNAHEHN